DTTLDTLAATLDSVHLHGTHYLENNLQLAEMQALADDAEGNLEALNVSNMLQGHVAQEVAKLNQLLAAQVNAQNVQLGMQLHLDATQEATERWLIEEATQPFHVYTGQGFTGVPAGFPGG
ncbi:MAG: hypothetical protein GY941_27295, partial [Planctomycetes bacterium]|nr:hypothetical protein [Planctomycetota bacterium]